MDTPLPEAPDSPTPASIGQGAAFVPPGFELLEHIGSGGMGAVYKARHTGMDSTVAVKILPPHAQADTASLQRFQREAKLLAALKHPNIVRVLAVASEGMQHALIMEHVDGVPLSTVLANQGFLDPERAKSLVSQAAKALAYAHSQKVAHRDLKPSNILVCKDADGHETIKLIDFGIARALDETEQKLTRTGAVIGTPFYMSPEQCSGARGDERSDIYALGCILYECLTGRVPLAGETPFEVMHKQLTEGPPHLADHLAKFDGVVQRAMAKDPADRYQSATEFQNALEHGEKTTGAQRMAPRVKLPFRANSRTLLAFSAITVVLAAGLLVVSFMHKEMETEVPLTSSEYNKVRREIVRKAIENRPPSKETVQTLYQLESRRSVGDFEDHRLCALALIYSYRQTDENPVLLALEAKEWQLAILALHRSNEISIYQPKRLAAVLDLTGNLRYAPNCFIDELQRAQKKGDVPLSQLAQLHAGLAAVYDKLGATDKAAAERSWMVQYVHMTPEQVARETTFHVIEHTIRDDEKAEIRKYSS